MTARPSSSAEWLFEHYLSDVGAEKAGVVVPAMDVMKSSNGSYGPRDDFAELHHDNNNKRVSHLRTTPRSKTRQHDEPFSPVYVKPQQQQHRDDDNNSGDRHHNHTPIVTPRGAPTLSPRYPHSGCGTPRSTTIAKAFDDIRARQQQDLQLRNSNRPLPAVSDMSSLGASASAVSGISSSVIVGTNSGDMIYQALQSPQPSSVQSTSSTTNATKMNKSKQHTRNKQFQQHRTTLSVALSEVTEEPLIQNCSMPSSSSSSRNSITHEEEWKTIITQHSILELCTEDLMSDIVFRVSLGLQQLITLCETKDNNHDHESTSASQKNIMKYTQCGGHAMLVGVMKKFPTHATILIPACQLVRTLVSTPAGDTNSTSGSGNGQEQSGNHAFAELFQAVAGLECVLTLLEYADKDHPDDETSVQSHAAMALTSLLHVGPKFVERFLQTDHTKRYLKVVQQHRLSTNGILSRLLYQLSTMSNTNKNITNNDGRTLLHQQAVVDLIVAELNQCPDSRSVQVYGCATLGNIFKQVMPTDMGTNCIPAILRAMKLFGNDEIVLERAISGIYYCCCRVPARHLDLLKHQAGGLSTISLAVECFPKNLVIQSRGSEIIKALLMSSSPSTKKLANNSKSGIRKQA